MFRHTVIVLLAMLGLSPRMATAEEVIKSFDAAIQLETSGGLDVTETITVHATGDRIRHGIYRDFPFSWPEGDDTAFKIVSIERDGRRDEWSRQAISGGTRIYLGSQNRTVPPGDHTYRIRYRTDNQVRRHDTYDNLVWNVTGNGWLFPIESATATVSLPGNAKPEDATVYTGPRGARGKDATAQLSGTTASFAMTRGLAIGEGLTIDVKIPKGVISPPKPAQKPYLGAWDERTALVGGSILAFALLILFSVWYLYGKDPSKGLTSLRWKPPEGLSPGLAAYIQDNGFSDSGYTSFSASLIDLAARGYLKIKATTDTAYIIRTNKPESGALHPEQRKILNHITSTMFYTTIDKKNKDSVESILTSYRDSIKAHNEEKYYYKQVDLKIVSIIFMISAILLSIYITNQNPWTLPVYILSVFVMSYIQMLFSLFLIIINYIIKLSDYYFNRILKYYMYFTIIAGSIGTIWLFLNNETVETKTELSLVLLFTPIASMIIFLMGKTTERGREIKDQIDGLRKYLSLSTSRRSTIRGLPAMTRKHFESLLPYAIVLGVEGPWLRAFEKSGNTSANPSAFDYNPGWWQDTSAGQARRRFGRVLCHAISMSMPNSSSFGSGSSGSGGGGGGGGGW